MLTDDTVRFIREHRRDDVRTLALQARKYPGVDMAAALTQIAGRQAAEEKIPTWAGVEGILYPPHLSMEQCSSEATARYKADIVSRLPRLDSFADLTGGFGIDCSFMARSFRQATCVERQPVLCETASHNFPLLGLGYIRVCNADCLHHLQAMSPVDCLFIDPARRDGRGGKTVAIADCEPDVSQLEDLLTQKSAYTLVKLSPMLDLTLALNDLKHVREAHIVSVAGECKELLLLLGHGAPLAPDDVPIRCVNLLPHAPMQQLTFTRRQERESDCRFAPVVRAYLYEPNASVLKAGAFRSIAHIYKVEKLHPNSHLYTSDHLLPDFPGRKFRVAATCGFGKKEVKDLLADTKRANLTVRNFPSTVADLRRRLKLAEGGDTYLFATTLADERRVMVISEHL
ncbi:MAG: SAM-dependent methyltransferase [Bacteroides sp.]|nr:SAM-dependent methyltransferase [Bacteroides sp.]